MVFVHDDDSLATGMKGFVIIDKAKEDLSMELTAKELVERRRELSSRVPFFELAQPIRVDRALRRAYPYLFHPGALGPLRDPAMGEEAEASAFDAEGAIEKVPVVQNANALPPANFSSLFPMLPGGVGPDGPRMPRRLPPLMPSNRRSPPLGRGQPKGP